MIYEKVSAEDELPPNTSHFGWDYSDKVTVFGITFHGEESMTVGFYDHKNKTWKPLTHGINKVTHWLKKVKPTPPDLIENHVEQ